MKHKIYVKVPQKNVIKEFDVGKKKKTFKGNPRAWSCKFWSENDVNEILQEVIQPSDIDITTIKKQDTLPPVLFDNNDSLNKDVRKKLLEIAINFIKYSKIEGYTYKDIILTGSMVNYNWTENSDIDLHILFDFSQIDDEQEFVAEYFNTKKDLWVREYPIKIKNHDVEVYVQDINEPHSSSGVYSLIKNDWTSKPIKQMIALDVADIQLKAANFMNIIDELEKIEDKENLIDEINIIKKKLKNARKSGLDNVGEYSTENLVFKILRNNGYLEKLNNLRNKTIVDLLTLEGEDKEKTPLIEGEIGEKLKKLFKVGLLTVGTVVALLSANISTEELRSSGIPSEMIEKAEMYLKTQFNNLKNNNNIK